MYLATYCFCQDNLFHPTHPDTQGPNHTSERGSSKPTGHHRTNDQAWSGTEIYIYLHLKERFIIKEYITEAAYPTCAILPHNKMAFVQICKSL